MDGPDMVISLKNDTQPYYVNGARSIAIADRPKVKKQQDEFQRKRHHRTSHRALQVGGTLVMVGKPDNSIRNVWITLSLINMSVNL